MCVCVWGGMMGVVQVVQGAVGNLVNHESPNTHTLAHPPPGVYLSVIALYYLLLVSILLSILCCSSPFLPL